MGYLQVTVYKLCCYKNTFNTLVKRLCGSMFFLPTVVQMMFFTCIMEKPAAMHSLQQGMEGSNPQGQGNIKVLQTKEITRIKSHVKRATSEEHPQFGDHACGYIVTDDFAEVYKNKRRMDAFLCMLEVSSIQTKMNFNEGTNAMIECLAEAGERY